MSDVESSKEGKGHQRLSGEENKWFSGGDDRWNFRKKKELWRAIRKSTNSETCLFVKKNGYRLMAVTNMRETLNKLSIFAFYLYNSSSPSTYAIGKFYLHFQQVNLYLFPLSLWQNEKNVLYIKFYIRGTSSSFASTVRKTILGLGNKLSKPKMFQM